MSLPAILFVPAAAAAEPAEAVLVFADNQLSPAAAALNGEGALTRMLALLPEPLGSGAIQVYTHTRGLAPDQCFVLGCGAAHDLTARTLEDLGGTLAARANQARVRRVMVRLEQGEALTGPEAAARFAEGVLLGSYRFDRYRTDLPESKQPTLEQVAIATPDPAGAEAAFALRRAVVEGVLFTRDLVSEPANILYPESFAERLKPLAELGLEVEVLDQAALAQKGFRTLLAVNQGSIREARVVVMRWRGGEPDAAPLALVGKGVCFDTGGISIKPAANMEDMKWDMAGAGVVAGTMKALAGRKAKANVIGIVGLVENMPSGSAIRPGDVVTSLSGKTVEIINTDAEGRLVLADLLTHVQAVDKPKAIIDLATLTGAIIIALGEDYAGMFANCDRMAEDLLAASARTEEKLWRMPLPKAYDSLLDSQIADMKNVGGRPGGSITAALFLQRFVRDTDWVHLDIAGVTWAGKDKPVVPKGGTGFGVRLLDNYVAHVWESSGT